MTDSHPTCSVVRWVDAKTAADAAGVTLTSMWRMVRRGVVHARRLGGERGRVRIAMDAENFPVFVRDGARA